METGQAMRLLGVSAGFSLADVDQRFRAQALVHHPDRGGDPQTMKSLVAARAHLVRSLEDPVSVSDPARGTAMPPDRPAAPTPPLDRVSFTTVSLVLLIPVAVMVALVVITLVVVSSVQ